MKISIILTLLILAAGMLLGWQDRQKHTSARERHARLSAEAAQSGIAHDPILQQNKKSNGKRELEDKEGTAKRIAADFIAAGKDMTLDDEMTDEMSGLVMSAALLDATQLKILFNDILASKDLTNESRRKLLRSLAEVASDRPQTTLTLLTESPDLLKIENLAKVLIYSSLTKWMKEDSMAALTWVRTNREVFSKFMDDHAKVGIVRSAAGNDPGLAFKLVDELEVSPLRRDSAWDQISIAPRSAEERTATLAAINAHFAALPAGEKKNQRSDQLIINLMNHAASDGFDAGTKWLDQAGLSPQQFSGMIQQNLVWVTALEETGKWVEWMGNLKTSQETTHLRNEMVRSWAEQDYRAAGKWLASTPEGPVRNSSISTFAKSISTQHPETAAQWATTLPPGEERANTLKTIYESWPNDDEAAKESFAKAHGFK